jgi:hypothetical protein
VGKHVYDTVAASGNLGVIPDFFAELHRYGRTTRKDLDESREL